MVISDGIAAPQTGLDAYEAKSEAYYQHARRDLYHFLRSGSPKAFHRVLNVGCGEGLDAPVLRDLGATYIAGVEPFGTAAEHARARYDEVIHARFEDWDTSSSQTFDLIVLADVLEHMASPLEALQRARKLLDNGGMALISVPNVRHISILFQLAILGEWRYSKQGILDQTHMRFFTARSLRRLVENAGYAPITLSFSHYGRSLSVRVIERLCPALSALLRSQVYCLARPLSRPA